MLPTTMARLAVSTLIVALGIAASSTPVAAEEHSGSAYTTEDVSFENDGLTLHGTVLIPSAQPAAPAATPFTGDPRHPAVVIVSGSGARERSDYLEEARAFAASGIVTLIYDKRTVGYSLTERSYAQLGDDAVAGLRLLQARPDVDPARAGMWGHSEGGWVVPLAAASHDEVGFVILAGASAHPPAEVQAWSTCRYLVQSGFPERLCGPVGVNLTRLMVEGGLFPEAAYDPLPALDQVRVPTLVLLAEFDQSTAPLTSARLFSETLSRSTDATVCVVRRADHEFHTSRNGFDGDEHFANGYVHLAPAWVGSLENGSFDCPSPIAAQQVGAPEPLGPLAWYESIGMHAVAGFVLLVAFLSYPVSALVRRLRGQREPGPAAWPARLVSAAGLVTLLGTVCLLGYVMATGATEPIGPVVLGRPAVWLLLQLLALVVVGAAAWTGIAWWQARDRVAVGAGVRLGTLLAGAIVLVPWAAWWGLFTV
ncbi:alpha/beta hydrolase family protein [Agromyces humatus]|uniref:Alpha/beta hydrolase n=1 Tax=Agromyces humatus TaxID=279573 RepID=A0ABP4WI85_9MICO|nr:alpha/beta hydrolase [Agromyces humatus]